MGNPKSQPSRATLFEACDRIAAMPGSFHRYVAFRELAKAVMGPIYASALNPDVPVRIAAPEQWLVDLNSEDKATFAIPKGGHEEFKIDDVHGRFGLVSEKMWFGTFQPLARGIAALEDSEGDLRRAEGALVSNFASPFGTAVVTASLSLHGAEVDILLERAASAQVGFDGGMFHLADRVGASVLDRNPLSFIEFDRQGDLVMFSRKSPMCCFAFMTRSDGSKCSSCSSRALSRADRVARFEAAACAFATLV